MHNVILVPCKDITPTSGILHVDLLEETKMIIDTTLNTKFLEDGTVSITFTKAHNILRATTSGSPFVYHLLMMKNPKLSSVCLASVDILVYSTS